MLFKKGKKKTKGTESGDGGGAEESDLTPKQRRRAQVRKAQMYVPSP